MHCFTTPVVKMQSNVVLGQPLSVPSDGSEGAGQWSTGLCDCFEDLDDCCLAFWCLPVFACKTSSAAGVCPCLPLLDCVACVPPASLAVRASVRERYGIEGDVWSDCFYGCCCYPLSWCQVSREMKRRAASASVSSSRMHSASYYRLTATQRAHVC
uniref:Uncharacterized protein n=2 Tax=Scleropages formosus TaxID=113540 RepID=A0A8C9TF18_SCLFO